MNPKIIPDAPRPISQGLSPRFSLSMTRVDNSLSPWLTDLLPVVCPPCVPCFSLNSWCCCVADGMRLVMIQKRRCIVQQAIWLCHGLEAPTTREPRRGSHSLLKSMRKNALVVQLNHMKDLRARVEQTFGFGPQQAPHSSSSASEALRMGPGSDIRVPLLKLPARVAEAPQAGGAEAPQAARLDYDVADVTGEVPGVGRVPGGMRAGVSASTLSADYASSSTNLVPRFSTQAGEHRAHRKRANNQKNEMASSALQQVTVGPWGGRRWIPPSSRHPRRAQVLACSQLSCLSPSCSPRDALQAFVCSSHLRLLLFACPLEELLAHEDGTGWRWWLC